MTGPPSPPTARSPAATASKRPRQKACQYCRRAFTKTEHLVRHERSHTKERPFRCKICSQAYGRRDTLLRHIKTHGEQLSGELPGDNIEVLSDNVNSIIPRRRQSSNASSRPSTGVAPSPSPVTTRAPDMFGSTSSSGTSAYDRFPAHLANGHNGNGGYAGQPPPPFAPNFMTRQEAPSGEIPIDPELQSWDAGGSNYPPWQSGTEFDVQAFGSSFLAPPFTDEPGQLPSQDDNQSKYPEI